MKKILIFLLCLGILPIHCQVADSKKFVLITTLYNEKNEARIGEYLTCLKSHLEHPRIKKIIVFYDTDRDDQKSVLLNALKMENNIVIKTISGRASFALFFDYANEFHQNENIIICNADIFFNDTLNTLDSIDLENKFLTLTRWNVTQSGDLELFKQYYNGSYLERSSQRSMDAWIFKSPLKKFNNPDIRLGLMGCDMAVAVQAMEAGLFVFNPCLSVQACHLHLSESRNYVKTEVPYKIPGSCYVPWCGFDNIKGGVYYDKQINY